MAAYDWGAGNVQRAVQRTGYADFWELYRRDVLPAETKNYVPIILAATIIAKNPTQYGLDTIVFDPPLLTDSVSTNYSVDLRLVADIVESSLQEIVALNPSLLRMATPPDDAFDLHLPPGAKELYTRRIEEIPVDRRKSWRFHKVAADDTIEAVAREYRVSPTELAFVNQLSPGSDLSDTEALVVPVTAAPSASITRSTRYTAKKGDTLVTVADRFNVSVDALRRWNHLKSASLVPGHTLYVSEPARVTSPSGKHRKSTGSRSQKGAKSAHKATAKAPPSTSGKTKTSSASAGKKHHPATP
jgi:membrane-bound lytic murein transglycosylase D